MNIKIMLVDDHAIVRRGLALFLHTQEKMEVVAECANGEESVRLYPTIQPHIILMDISMPVLNGIEATKQLKQVHPACKILVLSSYYDDNHIMSAIQAGADGYYVKESDPDELANAIRKVYEGDNQFHSKVAAQLANFMVKKRTSATQVLHESLTKRELEVMGEVAKGKSNKEIAAALYITEKTVKTHVTNILAKMNLQDRTQLAIYALKNGITQ